MRPRSAAPWAATALALLVGLLFVTSGCTDTAGTDGKQYISGDGQLTLVGRPDRGEPIELKGQDLDTVNLSLSDLRGKPVVINVWWSACGPCRAEQPELNDAAATLKGKAAFVGINIRDNSADVAQAYVRKFEVPYPSIYDPSGEALLAFSGTLSPRTVPATLVLDAQGRLAASIIGSIPSTLTLTGVVEDVAAEDAADTSGGVDG